ncbi:hypothetical protein ABR738_21845 [Streptomyces sp. Edi4]
MSTPAGSSATLVVPLTARHADQALALAIQPAGTDEDNVTFRPDA